MSWVLCTTGHYAGYYTRVYSSTSASSYVAASWGPPTYIFGTTGLIDLCTVQPPRDLNTQVGSPSGFEVQNNSGTSSFNLASGVNWFICAVLDPADVAWDPAADFGQFYDSLSNPITPFSSLAERPGLSRFSLDLVWSATLTKKLHTTSWVGNDDGQWQVPLQWSCVVDVEPPDDVEDDEPWALPLVLTCAITV